MTLSLLIGSQSIAGTKNINEDSVTTHLPESSYTLENRGAVCALADGVSSAEAGKEASKYACAQFVEDFYKTPETWSVAHAGDKILSSLNLTLFKRSHDYVQEEKGYLCTFTGLVLKSRTAHFFHVGDSRLFHIHENDIHQLTRDHTVAIGKGRRILSRALGMDSHLTIDYGNTPMSVGDYFVLTSDGVHDFIDQHKILDTVLLADSVEKAARQLCDQALKVGSDDNISAVVTQIVSLPTTSLEDFNNLLHRLPFPPDLSAGMVIDGYQIMDELFASARSQLYKVRDSATGDIHVMKTPSPNFVDDISYIDRFIQEEWIGRRINSPHVVKVLEQARPRHFLYYLMELVEGDSLDIWMQHNPLPEPKTAIKLIKQIAQALTTLHHHDTIHQDLKPANIMVTLGQGIKLVDFGSVYVAGVAEVFKPLEHEGALGTAAYSDPQYLLGKNTGVQGDLYALATIAYELFTGELPYGDRINECRSALDYDRLRYRSASQFNPVIPVWFDRALEKGVMFNPENRYKSLHELLRDLQTPNPQFLRHDPRLGDDRSPVMFWQIISGFWVIILLLVILLFSCQQS